MTDNLQFDRAEQTGPISCKGCGTALPDQYYVVNGNIVCENCRRSIEEEWNRGGAAGRLGKAVGLGILAIDRVRHRVVPRHQVDQQRVGHFSNRGGVGRRWRRA